MKFGYDLKNPKEKQMYIEKHKRNLKRSIEPKVNINDIIIENKNDLKYFIERDNEKEASEIFIENELIKLIDNSLDEIFD